MRSSWWIVILALVSVSGSALGSTMSPPELIAATPERHDNGGVLVSDGRMHVFGGCGAGADYGFLQARFDPATGLWESRASLPSGRSGLTAFALNGYFYSVGGEGPHGGSFNRNVWRYDPLHDESGWVTKNNFPVPSWDMMAAVCGGQAYVFGGRHGYGQTYAEMWQYDELNDAWLPRTPMPVPVRKAGVAVWNGRIYVFGGDQQPDEATHIIVRHIQVYDPANNTWELRADVLPRTVYPIAPIVQGDEVYLFAGHILGGASWVPNELIDIYDFAADCWHTAAMAPPCEYYSHSPAALINGFGYFIDATSPMAFRLQAEERLVPRDIALVPERHSDGGVLTYDGKLHVFGGIGAGADYGPLHSRYDPATDAWELRASLPSGRAGLAAFELNGYFYCVGGEGPYGGSFNRNVWRYDPLHDESGWVTENNFPVPSWDMMAAVCGGEAYVFGGRHGYGETYPQMWQYDEPNDIWVPRAPMPVPVRTAGVVVWNGHIYVFGGVYQPDESTSIVVRHIQVYDCATGTWELWADVLPRTLHPIAPLILGDEVYLHASHVAVGSTWQPNELIDVYNFVTACWHTAAMAPPFEYYTYSPAASINGFGYFVDGMSRAAFRVAPMTPRRLGDLNCDGAVDFGDINPFVAYLSNLSGWQRTYPECDALNGDINGDGTASFGDINPFVTLLAN